MEIINDNKYQWGLGIGDWGLGIGYWAQSPIPYEIILEIFFYSYHQLINFSLEDLKNKINAAVSRYVKEAVANAPAEHNIPVIAIESKIDLINEKVELYVKDRLSDLFGIFVTGKAPFKNVYLHGIVRDSKGVKMSKSKGNVINPIEILEKYGADALRMSLISGAGSGSDQNYSESKVIGYRNFANKIWNAARFVKEFESTESNKSYVSKYMKQIDETSKLITKKIDEYKLNNAAELIYKKFWNNFCDIRIEDAKKGLLSKDDLLYGLNVYLKLLHPFVPFVTEAVWSELGNNTLLITTSWPIMNNG